MSFQRFWLGLITAALLSSSCADGSGADPSTEVDPAYDPLLFGDLGEGTSAGRDSLPLGELCDGTPEAFYGEHLFERADCGTGALPIPTARVESAPRFDSPYLPHRCSTPLALQGTDERFDCAEAEFWVGFQDGRLLPRQHAVAYLGDAIAWSEWFARDTDEYRKKLARLYELRALGKTALGLENGRLDLLIFGDFQAGRDYARVKELDPDNVAAISFELTLGLTKARLLGWDARAAELAYDTLELGYTAGDPDVLERINVGIMMTVTAMTRDFPASTGLPAASLDAVLWARQLPGIQFNSENTPKAPFVRPGLEYMLASLYAQLGMRDEYIAQLEVVTAQDRYEDWAWYDFVEAQRADPDRMLAKYASFGEDEYSDSYAGSNDGCVFCHGGI